MGLATGKVFNENSHVLNDELRGVKISIEPGKSVDMDYYDYMKFKSEPPVGIPAGSWKDGTGKQNPATFKKLKYVGPKPDDAKDLSKQCMACDQKFATDTQLDLHIDMEHLDAMENQDVATKRRAKAK